MIDFYFSPTPNGQKIKLFFEETGLAHRVVPMSLSKGDQFKPEFLAISPNNKMPAIVDRAPADGGAPISVFESGAILMYLADKTKQFIPDDVRGRVMAMQWLFWQVGGLGPMIGQRHHFERYAQEKSPYAIDRYVREARRLVGVLDQRLTERAFICGDRYTIADMASYPWIVSHAADEGLDSFPNVQRWHDAIEARPATKRVYSRGETISAPGLKLTDEARWHLFGHGKPA